MLKKSNLLIRLIDSVDSFQLYTIFNVLILLVLVRHRLASSVAHDLPYKCSGSILCSQS